MGQTTTESTIEPGSSEMINGYRSGAGSQTTPVKNTCDVKVTAFDPFDFKVDWREKTVKTRRAKIDPRNSRRTRFYYEYVPVPYPYYVFQKKTRTVREWRLELSAGKSVLGKVPADLTPHISRQVKYLESMLRKRGPCRPAQPRSAGIQHPCLHWKTDIVGFPVAGVLRHSKLVDTVFVPLACNDAYGFRAFEYPHETFVGNQNEGVNTTHNSEVVRTTLSDPMSSAFASSTLGTVTAMLWPSSDDFAESTASPLIDIAEAASDGVFPLGPPPSAQEAHSRMVEMCMNDRHFSLLTEIIDFATDAYLWTTLVLEPVIQSAAALSTSVEANDKAIEAYKSRAATGKWHQGKSVRLFGREPLTAAKYFGAPDELSSTSWFGCTGQRSVTHTFDYKKFEANASMTYKLSEHDAIQMNSSGQRLGQFFSRLSTSLDTVIHNVLPLSFVYDWFSSEYTGILNLKDKVYMPVDSWKVTMSYKLDLNVKSKCTTTIRATTRTLYRGNVWIPYDISSTYRLSLYREYWNSCNTNFYPEVPEWFSSGNAYYITGNQYYLNEDSYSESTETHEFYDRRVYVNPTRRTDFSNGELGIDGFDTSKEDPLSDLGKQVTLGSLIWGFRDLR